ncbi:MAG: hypothetical protein C4527_11765 [Candidatus Omnitrophota bacterium]|jgi:enamine deaminase RidA (YjgF/YER057c/UK114 family)|nr:MAG: hypothetical protein C4527_11765 [Candidatus Omnitrophota bacterium]
MLYTSAKNCSGDLCFITVLPSPGMDAENSVRSAYEELTDFLTSRRAALVHERVYGRVSLAPMVNQLRESLLKSTSIPLTYVEGIPFDDSEFAGIHALAVPIGEPASFRFIEKSDHVCGCEFRGDEAEYLFLSDVARLLPPSAKESRSRETYEAIKLAGEILHEKNWSYHDVRRTWFYLDDILAWYPDFNKARNELYKRLGLFNGNPKTIIPASTGIWGKSAHGAACTLDLLAMRPVEGRPLQCKRLENPKQNEATDYGSAFSRGLSITTHSNKYIFVSGTASIDEEGKTIHLGDMKRQTERTLKNIDSLLRNAGARLNQIQQATAFVKIQEDIPIFEEVLADMGLSHIPIVRTLADVCRDDLLFELDATAVIPSL